MSLTSPASANGTIPENVSAAYRMMFAIITPALITGAFANRVTFKAYMALLTAWLLRPPPQFSPQARTRLW